MIDVRNRAWAVLVTGVFTLGLSSGVRSQDGFDPEKHFPSPALAYVSIDSIDGLKDGLASTLLGRIVSHPMTRRACAGFERGVRAAFQKGLEESMGGDAEEFREALGVGPLELAGLFTGRIAMSFRLGGMGPELGLAIGYGTKEAELQRVYARLLKSYEDEVGEIQRGEIQGVPFDGWPTPAGLLRKLDLGGHLLFVLGDDMARETVALFRGGADGTPLAESPLLKSLARTLDVDNRQITFALDVGTVRQMALGAAGGDAEEIVKMLEFTGLDRFQVLGGALGFKDGGAQTSFLALCEGGAGGLHKAIQEGLLEVGDPSEALALLPASTDELSAVRVNPGAMLKAVETLARATFPEAGDAIDEGLRELDRFAGFPVRPVLESLGPITVVGAAIRPPAGGLIADQLLLTKSAELAPYWALLEKIGERLGVASETLEGAGGAKIVYFNAGRPFTENGGLFAAFLESGDFDDLDPERFGPQLAATSFVAARHDLAGGWSVLSTAPQPVLRYVSHHARGPRLTEAEDFAAEAKRRFEKATLASVFRAGPTALAVYNTIVAVGNAVSPYGALVGIEFGLFPPAEEFLDAQGIGFVEVRSRDRGFSVRTERALESGGVILVAGVGGAAVVAGLVTPVLMRGREQAQKIQSTNHLKILHGAMLTYANKKFQFPFAPGGSSVDSFNVLLKHSAGKDLTPDLFVRPDGAEWPAEVDENGRFTLTEDNLSYEVVPWKMKSFGVPKVLVYERDARDDGKVLVLFTDGSIQDMYQFELEERLEAENPENR